MRIDTCGLILADDKRINLGELMRPRALGAVPFGGRYRIIDFNLSNMVNSGITSIGVSTFNKYKSLMDHIGTGSAWDLDRKRQGLSILPPYISSDAYSGESDDLLGILNFFRARREQYMIITSSNVIMTTAYNDFVESHVESGADMSVMYNRDGINSGEPNLILDLDRRGHLREAYTNPAKPVSTRSSLGTVCIKRELFLDMISYAISRGIPEVSIEYLIREHKSINVRGYEYKGVALRINSVQEYFDATMRSLTEDVAEALYWTENPVYTKVKDEAPAFFGETSEVKGSMVSDGCYIAGEVSESMLFRGVQVGEGAKLDNCIIFQNTQIGEGCTLSHVIIDKNCTIRPGISLIGQPDYPVVIGKGATV